MRRSRTIFFIAEVHNYCVGPPLVINAQPGVTCKMAGVFDIELHDDDTGQLDDSDDDAIEVEEVSMFVYTF